VQSSRKGDAPLFTSACRRDRRLLFARSPCRIRFIPGHGPISDPGVEQQCPNDKESDTDNEYCDGSEDPTRFVLV
jgi:hypothetical protein